MRELKKHKLPPRKWYNLEQASEKLTNEIGEKVTERDIIYYANQGYLELSVYIDFEKIDDNEYKLDIRNSNLNDGVLSEAYSVDVYSWQDYPQVDFISGKLFKAVVNNLIDMTEIMRKVKDECYSSQLGLVDGDFLLQETDKYIPVLQDIIINNTGNLNLKTNIEKLKGFFAIDFTDFEDILIDEDNPIINTDDLTFRPSRNENIENGFGFRISALSFFRKSLIEINKNSIFITLEEIENLKNADKKMRSLNSFESYIEEWKQPTRIINPSTVKQENIFVETDNLKMFTLKTIPALSHSAQSEKVKNKGGRPSSPYTQKIVELGKQIFKNNPDVNRESIANAILDYFNDQNIVLNIQLVRRNLKENNIGLIGGKSKKINPLS